MDKWTTNVTCCHLKLCLEILCIRLIIHEYGKMTLLMNMNENMV